MKRWIVHWIVWVCILAVKVQAKEPVEVILDHAVTQGERIWGLMGRKTLPTNQGMLFHLPPDGNKHGVWMFNCFIDLSIAFLDQEQRIIRLFDLKSYPEKMDPQRPVRALSDLVLYPPGDPITQFFQNQAVTAPPSTRYILEMNLHWFRDKGVKEGDRLFWSGQKGIIIPTGTG